MNNNVVIAYFSFNNSSESSHELFELNFGMEYSFKVNHDDRLIIISRNDNYLEDYFTLSPDLCLKKKLPLSISALIGKNGSGKSVCLENLLLILLQEESNTEKVVLCLKIDKEYKFFSDLDLSEYTIIDYRRKINIVGKALKFDCLINIYQYLNESYLAYYSPQLSSRRLSYLSSNEFFLNHSQTYRLNHSISPINLSRDNRNTSLSPHLHGIYDTFQISPYDFFDSKNSLQQIELILNLKLAKYGGNKSTKLSKKLDEILEFEIPRKIKITSDFLKYNLSDFKMEMVNRSQILGAEDIKTNKFEKSIYNLTSIYIERIKNGSDVNSLIKHHFNRIIDAYFKDIYKLYNYIGFEIKLKEFLDDLEYTVESSNKMDSEVSVEEISLWTKHFEDLIVYFNTTIPPKELEKRKDIMADIIKITQSYNNLMNSYFSLFRILLQEDNLSKISRTNNVSYQVANYKNRALTLPDTDDLANEFYLDLKNMDVVTQNLLYNLVKSINNIYSSKLPVRIEWGHVLSAGEYHKLSLLTFFSSVRRTLQKSSGDSKKNIIVVMDEPDTYMHPDWERRTVEEIVELTNLLFENMHSVQVLISTNKPVLLTDLPGYCVNYMHIKNDILKPKESTLYKDIHSLYREDFIISESVGSFAKSKVSELISRLNNDGKIKASDIKLVDLIGDNNIKSKLHSMIEKNKQVDTSGFAKMIMSNYSKDDVNKIIDLLKEDNYVE